MPYLRRKKRYNRSRRRRKGPGYKRRRRRKRYSTGYVMRVRGTTGFPDRLKCKLKYNTTVNLANVAGLGTDFFSLNSPYNPEPNGPLSQPPAYVEYAALYNRYECFASKIIIRPYTNTTNPCKMVVWPTVASVATGDLETAAMQSYARSLGLSNSNSYMRALTNYMSVRKLEGRNTYDENFSSDTSSGPVAIRYWHFLVQSYDSIDISTLDFDVTIIYYVEFSRRKQALPGP